MSTAAEIRLARRVLRHELEALQTHWIGFMVLGIILVVIGMIAVGIPIVSSFASAFAFGSLLLIGGIAQLVGAFWTRDWSGFFLSLLMGVLYVVVGVLFLRHPGDALMAMTLFLACALMIGGLFRNPWVGYVSLPALGLDVRWWCHQPSAGHYDLAAMAGI